MVYGYALIMLLTGFCIPFIGALNASLGRELGSPAGASVVLFFVALASSSLTLLYTGPGAVSKLASVPKVLFLGGILISFYVISITFIAPKFGLGNAIFMILLGQIISAAIIDHYGLLGSIEKPISFIKGIGLILMAFGVWLTQLNVTTTGAGN